jgi:hypothetical protein
MCANIVIHTNKFQFTWNCKIHVGEDKMNIKKMFLFKDNNEIYIHIISSWYKQFGFDGNFEFMFFGVLSMVMQLH